jgi:hypothetical protein
MVHTVAPSRYIANGAFELRTLHKFLLAGNAGILVLHAIS